MELEYLVTSARAGDRAAYGAIVRRFQDMAFSGAYAWLGDPEDARDAAQDAFVEAWEKLDSLREPAAFPGWFRCIVVKQADRHLRRRRPVAPASVLEGMPSALPDPSALAESAEVREVVRAAIASLPEAQRLPLTLFHLDGYRQKEVAAFHELPVSAVKKRIFDARRALQEKVLHMVEQTVDQSRPSRDDSFARKVEFWVAFQDRDLAAMERLIESDPSLLEATSDWESAPNLRAEGVEGTAARLAVAMDDADMLSMLLARGADVNQTDDHVDSLLHVAAMDGHVDFVGLLISRGADLDRRGSCVQTPLHRAAMRGDREIAALLVDAGADLEATDHRGRTATDWAALKGRAELLQWLVERGARQTDLPLRVPRRLKVPVRKSERRIPTGPDALGRQLDALGRSGDSGPDPARVLHASVEQDPPVALETGLKAVDLVAPFPRGGQVGIDFGDGVGRLVLVLQIARNVIESYDGRVVGVGVANEKDLGGHLREWTSFVADGHLQAGNTTHVLARDDEPDTFAQAAETGLSLAEDLRQAGHDVLLYVDSVVALADGVLPMLRGQTSYAPGAAITICYLGDLPAGLDRPEFPFLDAVLRSDTRRARAGLYPAVDLAGSRSRLLDDARLPAEHRDVVERARRCFRLLSTCAANGPVESRLTHIPAGDRDATRQLLVRARRLDLFLTQRVHGTEMWMGEPGETVAMRDTVEGVRQILDGDHDDLPEEAFQFVGTIDQVLEKAQRL